MENPDFADALEPHYNDLVRYCRALVTHGSRTTPEDVLQESLLKALLNYHRLRDPDRFRVWLFQIVTRTYVSETRRAFWRRLIPLETLHHMPPVYEEPETSERLHLLQALARLPLRQRSALLLFELAGFSIEEIRTIQGDRSLSAVKSRLARARESLRQNLQIRPNVTLDLYDETISETWHALEALGRHPGADHAGPAQRD